MDPLKKLIRVCSRLLPSSAIIPKTNSMRMRFFTRTASGQPPLTRYQRVVITCKSSLFWAQYKGLKNPKPKSQQERSCWLFYQTPDFNDTPIASAFTLQAYGHQLGDMRSFDLRLLTAFLASECSQKPLAVREVESYIHSSRNSPP